MKKTEENTDEEWIIGREKEIEGYNKAIDDVIKKMKFDLLSELETNLEVNGKEVETITIDKKEWQSIYNKAIQDVIKKLEE